MGAMQRVARVNLRRQRRLCKDYCIGIGVRNSRMVELDWLDLHKLSTTNSRQVESVEFEHYHNRKLNKAIDR